MAHVQAKKKPDFLALEEAFANIKQKQDVKDELRRIQRILKRQFDLDFSISIIDNNTNEFFGMSIYPSRNVVDALISHMIEKKSKSEVIEEIWAKNKEWVLEIDSILLYDTTLNANPAEIVAVLLHEVGHVVFSNTIPRRVNKVLRYELVHLTANMKKLVTWNKAQKLFDLVIIEACGSKNYHTKRELEADKFVAKLGYDDNLSNFIGKLILIDGNRRIDRSEKEMEKDVRSIVTWTIDNISELEFRKKKLRSMLQTELFQNPSKYVRGLVYDIKSVFFGGADEDLYKELIKEQYLIKERDQIVQEGLLNLFDKFGRVKKIDPSDIDFIEVEKGRIDNDDDKIYVLDLIYDQLDKIEVALDMIKDKKQDRVYNSKDSLLRYKKRLETLRREVLDIQLRDDRYGIFINYPKGYEG